ncbi:MAG: ABC transporter substrate-binding protein [Chitinophagaceae bacterium]
MKNICISLGCTLFLLALHGISTAQLNSQLPRYKIAVFAPLYLDSAFDVNEEYRYSKSFPKFFSPGLEFYEGVQLAADSLNKVGAPLDIQIYDTRSAMSSPESVSQKPEFNNVQLIIGHVTNSEIRVLADIARKKNIPFINANIPNDGGVTNNPSLVILNSTLRTHCQAIYKFLQKNYGNSPVIVFRKKGVQEDILKNYFTEVERSLPSASLKLRYVTLNNDFTGAQLKSYLDSSLTICIASSLDEKFATQLCLALASIKEEYPTKVMGMPTWDGIKDFSKKEYKGLEIFYSTPFYNAKTDKVSSGINNYFKTYLYSRPSDMVFRGYECIMRFGKLLMEKGANIGSSIGEKKYRTFTDFDIQPVFLNKQSPTLDYFENKKLYFVKLQDGVVKAVY